MSYALKAMVATIVMCGACFADPCSNRSCKIPEGVSDSGNASPPEDSLGLLQKHTYTVSNNLQGGSKKAVEGGSWGYLESFVETLKTGTDGYWEPFVETLQNGTDRVQMRLYQGGSSLVQTIRSGLSGGNPYQEGAYSQLALAYEVAAGKKCGINSGTDVMQLLLPSVLVPFEYSSYPAQQFAKHGDLAYSMAHTKFHTQQIMHSLSKNHASFIILVGAGFDTSCYTEPVLMTMRSNGATCVEIDYPDIMIKKRSLLTNGGTDVSHVKHVGIDFEKESLAEAFTREEVNLEGDIHWILAGTSQLMSEMQVDEFFLFIRSVGAGRSTLAWDFLDSAVLVCAKDPHGDHCSDLDAEMRGIQASAIEAETQGTPLRFALPCRHEREPHLSEFHMRRGFTLVSSYDNKELLEEQCADDSDLPTLGYGCTALARQMPIDNVGSSSE